MAATQYVRRTITLAVLASCLGILPLLSHSAGSKEAATETVVTAKAKDILGDPDYLAYSYGAYRGEHRGTSEPTLNELKEDLRILSAMGVRLIRTYSTRAEHTPRLLQAIRELGQQPPREGKPPFEMHVMLGAWIECQGAWSDAPDHENQSEDNGPEIQTAIELANEYPESVKIIAVGNESMVHWAEGYYVRPKIILEWVEHLQDLKQTGQLSKDIWITSSENFAAWGGIAEYQTEDLRKLIRAVDFVSLHTYPYHDTHYNPSFWKTPADLKDKTPLEKIDAAMARAKQHAQNEFKNTSDYIHSVAPNKPVHIGETGWSTRDTGIRGPEGSRAADEYKAKIYHDAIRKWTRAANITCFYFEAFDEPWKAIATRDESESHFGMINIEGQAKFALWDLVDAGVFQGLTRGGQPITKTYAGDKSQVLSAAMVLPE